MGDYDDIISLPHHVSKRHPQMSMWNRAAQFAPFSALVGHDEAIKEEGRLTETWKDMGDFNSEALNRKMAILTMKLPSQPAVTIQHFMPDKHKSGGSYHTVSGNVKRIDETERRIELSDGTMISIDNITEITIE